MTNNGSVEALNAFLRRELAAVATYEQALAKLPPSPVRDALVDCHRLHEDNVRRLDARVRALGGAPAKDGGVFGAFLQLIEGAAVAIGERSMVAVLEQEEDNGLAHYRQDREGLDPESRQLVETELLSSQEKSHRAMSALKGALEP